MALGACGDNQASFDVILTSEHFRVYVHRGAVAPEHTIELLETHYRDTRAFLHFPEVVVDYHLFPTLEAATLACLGTLAEGLVNCAKGNTVFSCQPVHEHELIHAYMAGVGSPPPLVQEGIAVDDRREALDLDRAWRDR